MRTGVLAALALLISAPVSIVVTLILLPLWRWSEFSGFEAIGHSGPAEWCFLAIFTLVAIGSLPGVWMLQGLRRSEVDRT